jgi:hypothetical protein
MSKRNTNANCYRFTAKRAKIAKLNVVEMGSFK